MLVYEKSRIVSWLFMIGMVKTEKILSSKTFPFTTISTTNR